MENTTQPGAQAPFQQAGPPPARQAIPPRKIIAAGVIALLVIAAAVIGHSLASSQSIAVGDCVTTSPSLTSGWDIKKVPCTSNPGSALTVQKVVSVQSGSNGECGSGLTTFQDQPSNQTYCLGYTFAGG